MTATPSGGIRLAGGTAPPPAPSLGRTVPVHSGRHRLGSVTATHPGEWVPVCGQCFTALDTQPHRLDANAALRRHWVIEHPGDVA